MAEKNGSFVLKNVLVLALVKGVHKIPETRRCVKDASRAVLDVKVQEGVLEEGDEIILQSPAGEELNDIAGRIEINRHRYLTATKGVNAGVLLLKTSPEDLLDFGLPLLRVRTHREVKEVMLP